jgi:hypothetical protein
MRPKSKNPLRRSTYLALVLAALALSAPAWGAQTITICKTTVPPGGTGFQISRSNGAGALPSFTLNDGQCTTFDMTGQDHFNRFTETVPGGWTLANILCVHTTTPVTILGANLNPAFQSGDNTVTMDLNEQNVTCTFVNQQQPSCWAEICVKKYRDTNGDGVQESGEPTLPGWTFQFVNGSMVISATTNKKGIACARVPAPATYTVSEVQQPGWVPTLPAGGTQTVTIAAGQVVNLSFGNRPKKRPGT